jgi:hypothetical protein
LERVRKASLPRGKKKELGKFLRAPKQQVYAWLNGVRAPGGEVALLMLEWVQAEEAKQTKNRGDATNTTTAKTRNPQSRYEKRKRVRKDR